MERNHGGLLRCAAAVDESRGSAGSSGNDPAKPTVQKIPRHAYGRPAEGGTDSSHVGPVLSRPHTVIAPAIAVVPDDAERMVGRQRSPIWLVSTALWTEGIVSP